MQLLASLPYKVGALTVNEIELIPEISVRNKRRLGDQTRFFTVGGVFDPHPFGFLFWIGVALASAKYKGVGEPRSLHLFRL